VGNEQFRVLEDLGRLFQAGCGIQVTYNERKKLKK
jgi:hypothetical protein